MSKEKKKPKPPKPDVKLREVLYKHRDKKKQEG